MLTSQRPAQTLATPMDETKAMQAVQDGLAIAEATGKGFKEKMKRPPVQSFWAYRLDARRQPPPLCISLHSSSNLKRRNGDSRSARHRAALSPS